MTATVRPALKKVTLHAARSKEFPDGSIRHGYEFAAPLTPEPGGSTWRPGRLVAANVSCIASGATNRRSAVFWCIAPAGAAARAGRSNTDRSPRRDEEEAGYRFGDHVFRVGEYVSIREEGGELVPFKVVEVS